MFLNVDSLTLGWLVTGKVEMFVPRAAQTAVVPRAAQTAVAAVHRAAVVPRAAQTAVAAAQTAVVPRAAQTAVVHTVVVVQHGWRIVVD
jgi:hypothetical protein